MDTRSEHSGNNTGNGRKNATRVKDEVSGVVGAGGAGAAAGARGAFRVVVR